MPERLRGLARKARSTIRSAALLVAAVGAALGLAALALAAGLMLASTLSISAVGEPAGLAFWIATLPWIGALLGIVAAGLALAAQPTHLQATALAAALKNALLQVPRSDSAASTMMASEVAEMQETMREMRATIQAECRDLATARQAFGAAAHEVMLVGARLSGVSLDAEARLVAGVAGAEEALRHPEGVLARASAASLWLERTLPELASLIDAGHRAHSGGVDQGGAATLDIATDLASRKVDQIVTQVGNEIEGQIAILETVADRLRRDTAALVAVGHEIAAAGAGVLARVGKAAGQAGAALEALPQAAATVSQVAGLLAHEAESVRQGLATAGVTAVQDLTAAAAQSHTCIAQAGTHLQAVMSEATREASQWMALWGEAQKEMLGAPQAIRAEIREAMRDAAEDMARDAARAITERLDQTGDVLRQLNEASAVVSSRMDAVATRADAALNGLSALPAHTDRLESAASLLRDEREMLAQAGQALAVTGADMTMRMQVSDERIATALRTVDATALADMVAGTLAYTVKNFIEQAVTEACAQPLQMLVEASAVLCADSASLDAAGRDALASLQREAEFLLAAGQLIAADGAGIVARLLETTAAISAAGIEAEARASDAAMSAATLPRITAELIEIAAALQRTVTSVDAARPDATRFEMAGDSLTQAVAHAASALRAVPILTADLTQAATRLQDEAQALGHTAGQMRDDGTETTLRLKSLTDALEPDPKAAASMLIALTAHVDRLETLVARLHAASTPDELVSIDVAGERAAHAQIAEVLNAALARHDASTRAVMVAMMRVEAAAEAVRLAAPNAAASVAMCQGELPGPAEILRHLGGVESETAMLLGQAEALAEAVLGGHVSPLPLELARRMPDLLAGVETTIGRLRSVATALALAYDGPGTRIATLLAPTLPPLVTVPANNTRDSHPAVGATAA